MQGPPFVKWNYTTQDQGTMNLGMNKKIAIPLIMVPADKLPS